jgi:stage IV sporulation protein FB
MIYFAAGMLDRAVIAFSAVALHEAGHVLAARRLGLKAASVELFPFGGVARLEGSGVFSPLKEINIALAGPLLSAALFCFGLGLSQWGYLGGGRGHFFLTVNLVLAAFNLLPGLPLDGGRILRAWLYRKKGLVGATIYAAGVGQFIGLLIVVLGVMGLVYRQTGFDIAVLGLFIFCAATREKLRAPYLFAHHLAVRERFLPERRILQGALLAVPEHILLVEVARRFMPGSFYFIVVIDGKGGRKGLFTEVEVLTALTTRGPGATAGVLVEKGSGEGVF